ncbi:carbonic anhydrase [Aquabacterium sp.]|uniref:carbonic anhydrase n=1 Tax=Aquabacterium sp. TaxID=1872578 RepID=UPI0025B8D687|nr:carbonic anhydrase family protein [Aquabacterium sp.]
MPKSFFTCYASQLILAVGLSACPDAWAADHGADHGGGHEPKAAAKPAAKAEAKAEPKAEAKVEPKEADIKPKLKAEAKPEAGESRGSVSMTELREMIDQKIAEVRTKQAPAVVRIQPRSAPKAKPTLLAAAHGSQGELLPAGKPGEGHGAMGHDVHWAYSGDTGPDSWGRLKPEFQQCMLGKRQSPIDIREGIPVQLDPIQFDYRPTNFRVLDNGHTVQVNLDPGNSITVNGRRYDLLQFHFHRPSEERINGRQFEMVAHFVHKDMDGKLAVVAVLMDQGKAHPMVQLVWNNLPLEKGTEQGALQQIDLSMMLPEARQYYTYMGSLTTPPCSEGVLWMVMKQPATVSREQVAVFSKLYPMNARPIQQASGRLIKDGQ